MSEDVDWFEKITGFKESDFDFDQIKSKLCFLDDNLYSTEKADSSPLGHMEIPSLAELRVRLKILSKVTSRGVLKLEEISADARELHSRQENFFAVFQVASQFNLLEMASPNITPEHGVTRYSQDHTQGPACAIACGANTIYRNYLMPRTDTLLDVAEVLKRQLGPGYFLWNMQNGYAMFEHRDIARISSFIEHASEQQKDRIRAALRIGIAWEALVTDAYPGPYVSQVFCSALPVAYHQNIPLSVWQPFAQLILEAAYEATLSAAVLSEQRKVFLTRLGGGAFGNDPKWIDAAMKRALDMFSSYDLDVKIVNKP